MKREKVDWVEATVVCADDTTSPRILFVGDSITNSYYWIIRDMFAEKNILCDRYVTSHAMCDPVFIKDVDMMICEEQGYKYDVIHFNNGLHSGGYSTEEFEKYYRKTINYISKLQPQAKLILVTCTPYTKVGTEGTLDEVLNKNVLAYNEVIRKLAAEYNLPCDDRFYAVAANAAYPQPDGVHYGDAGKQKLAETSFEFICANL